MISTRLRQRLTGCLLLVLVGLLPLAIIPVGAQAATPAGPAGWRFKGGTLSVDPQGWASHPSIAIGSDGHPIVVWSQHLNPLKWQKSSLYIKKWTGSGWQPLGGPVQKPGGAWNEAYDPDIAVLNGTPYLTWYEGGGYGWGLDPPTKTSVFVAHWNGSQWVFDGHPESSNGSLNTNVATYDARNPSIAVIDGTIYVAWIELRTIPNSNDLYNVVIVKHLENGRWVQDGSPVLVGGAEAKMMIDVAIADVGGVPHLAFSQWKYSAHSSVHAFRFVKGTWEPLGDSLNALSRGFANYLDIVSHAGAPHVAWQEKTQTGVYQIYVKRWDGSRWVAHGGALNAHPDSGEAGRPSLASAGTKLMLAWAEGRRGEKAQVYVRTLTGSGGGELEGSLNVDPTDSGADTAVIALSSTGVPFVAWAEKNVERLLPKQVYVRGKEGGERGKEGADSFVAAAPTRFGANGLTPTIAPNTWVYMNAGGLTGSGASTATGIGDEGFNTFSYAPHLKRAVTLGQYHARSVTDGEDQNALMAYSFTENRWDLVEITEADGSEFLSGVGHDEGNAVVDTVHGLYISHGNLTVHGNAAYKTFIYDLKTGRGARMMPVPEAPFGSSVIMAFDPEHEIVLASKGPGYLYDRAANSWVSIPGGPSPRQSPSLTYDSKNHVFILFGGGDLDETWTFNPVTRVWTKKSPPTSPPGRTAGNFAFDPVHGVALLAGGENHKTAASLRDTWVYDAAADRWTNLNITTPADTNPGAGNLLTYDSDNKLFLLKHGTNLNRVYAFRYEPRRAGTTPPASSPVRLASLDDPPAVRIPSPPSPLRVAAADPPPPGQQIALPLRTWVARPLPEMGKGPCPKWHGCKHVHLAVNPLNGRIYFEGGDYAGPPYKDDAYRNETYSYSIRDDNWVLEYPYCGPAGDIQPDRPDEVGWVWDSRRNIFWMIPGYMESLSQGKPGCGGAIQTWAIMTFDPATKKWSPGGVHWRNPGGTERPKYAQYDPVTDSIIMFNNGMAVDILHLSRDWGSQSRWERFAIGGELSNSFLNGEGTAIDVAGRAIYVIEPYTGRLIRYNIDAKTATVLGTAPERSGDDGGPPHPPGSPRHREDFTQLAFDTRNRVLFYMRLNGAGEIPTDPLATGHAGSYVTLYIYDPSTKQWTRDPMRQPEGQLVRGNTMVYHEAENVLLLIGGIPTDGHPTSASGIGPRPSHFYLYRYGDGTTPR
jgi:hypothetical protein